MLFVTRQSVCPGQTFAGLITAIVSFLFCASMGCKEVSGRWLMVAGGASRAWRAPAAA